MFQKEAFRFMVDFLFQYSVVVCPCVLLGNPKKYCFKKHGFYQLFLLTTHREQPGATASVFEWVGFWDPFRLHTRRRCLPSEPTVSWLLPTGAAFYMTQWQSDHNVALCTGCIRVSLCLFVYTLLVHRGLEYCMMFVCSLCVCVCAHMCVEIWDLFKR